MKNSNSFSILIWANKAKSDVNGLIPLYARVTVMGKRAEISLKKKVSPAKWDAKTGFMKGSGNEVRTVNTTMSYIKRLKRIITIAVNNHWISTNPFSAFKCTSQKVEREELTEDEVKRLAEKTFSVKRLDEVRDCFLFSCYTGYAFVDASKLSWANITVGKDDEMWVRTSRTKTEIAANVPLLPQAIEIINKYKDHEECIYSGRILPMKSNQKMNAYLKEIADLCGINKNLTTHMARHTFATTITLGNGVPIESVSKMLGHTKITTTQIYARVAEQKVGKDMKQLKLKICDL